MLAHNKQIAIVGGGPGGLTLARLLQMQGVRVKVYERDLNRDSRVQGSPLDMHDESGLAALKKAGLLDAFRDNFMPGADRMHIMNERAETVFSDHGSDNGDFGSPHFRPEIDRGALRRILLESLEPETVIWYSHFISMERHGEGWTLHFRNGSSAYADIVVAADGANSKIRPYLTSIKPFYSGVTMIEGNIYDAKAKAPNISGLLDGGKIMAFGNEKNLLMGTKGNGDIGFYASLTADESWAGNNDLDYADRTQVLDWFRKEYTGWSSIWEELFEQADLPFVPRPIYCMPPDQNWDPLPNLTMLGDAAHAMPPFAGEGANMAMLDALELSACLTSEQYPTLREAIAAYESAMRTRAAGAAEESLVNGRRMHAPDSLEAMVRMFGGA